MNEFNPQNHLSDTALVTVKQVALDILASHYLTDTHCVTQRDIVNIIWSLASNENYKIYLVKSSSGHWLCHHDQVCAAYKAEQDKKEDDPLYKIINCVVDLNKPNQFPPIDFGTDWVIEEDGSLYNPVHAYEIEASRLKENDLIEHMNGKAWCDMNEFCDVYFAALSAYRQKQKEHRPTE